jgi:hypothetical protein
MSYETVIPTDRDNVEEILENNLPEDGDYVEEANVCVGDLKFDLKNLTYTKEEMIELISDMYTRGHRVLAYNSHFTMGCSFPSEDVLEVKDLFVFRNLKNLIEKENPTEISCEIESLMKKSGDKTIEWMQCLEYCIRESNMNSKCAFQV